MKFFTKICVLIFNVLILVGGAQAKDLGSIEFLPNNMQRISLPNNQYILMNASGDLADLFLENLDDLKAFVRGFYRYFENHACLDYYGGSRFHPAYMACKVLRDIGALKKMPFGGDPKLYFQVPWKFLKCSTAAALVALLLYAGVRWYKQKEKKVLKKQDDIVTPEKAPNKDESDFLTLE